MEAHAGVKGLVLDERKKPIMNAVVQVDDFNPVKTSREGEFWKLLRPGNYTLVGPPKCLLSFILISAGGDG